MKKNKMMRIASVLLVAVLISTCAISGTFAKYVTKVSGEDSARVAKWGIVLDLQNAELFKDTYAKDDTTFKGENTVVIAEDNEGVAEIASDYVKLVAPGTKSDKALTAKVTGTPEVATRYSLRIEGLKDVFLKANTYIDYTELVKTDAKPATETESAVAASYGYTKTFELKEDYYPVKWDLKVSKGSTSYTLSEVATAITGETYDGFSLKEAEAIVNNSTIMNQLLPQLEGMVTGASNAQVTKDGDAIVISMDFEAGKEMNFTFELTWKWAFENGEELEDEEGNKTGIFEFDAADTLLGNLVCADFTYGGETALTADTDYSVVLEAKLTATATQID